MHIFMYMSMYVLYMFVRVFDDTIYNILDMHARRPCTLPRCLALSIITFVSCIMELYIFCYPERERERYYTYICIHT